MPPSFFPRYVPVTAPEWRSLSPAPEHVQFADEGAAQRFREEQARWYRDHSDGLQLAAGHTT